tara:strand:+ start:6965 stop:8020 length:1056 start_codon:yes stop_codon:yes gene_type:complete
MADEDEFIVIDEPSEEEASLEEAGIDGPLEEDIVLSDVGTVINEDGDKKQTFETDKETEIEVIPEEKEKSEKTVGSSELSEEETKKLGGRAQRRIQQLVKRAKEAEGIINERDNQIAEMLHKTTELEAKTQSRERALIDQYEDKISSQEDSVIHALRRAKEEGDIDAELIATDNLAQVKAEKLMLDRARQAVEQRDAAQEKRQENNEAAVGQSAPRRQRPDKSALAWRKDNLWFGGDSTKHKMMTASAADIHQDLMEEGFIPYPEDQEAVTSYYEELNSRIKNEFPEEFTDSETTPQSQQRVKQIVAGGSRTTGKRSKGKVSLTQRELATAKRLGVDPVKYAREKQRIAAS